MLCTRLVSKGHEIGWTFSSALLSAWGYVMLMSPNKDETAVHGCHCTGIWLCACVRYRPHRWLCLCVPLASLILISSKHSVPKFLAKGPFNSLKHEIFHLQISREAFSAGQMLCRCLLHLLCSCSYLLDLIVGC